MKKLFITALLFIPLTMFGKDLVRVAVFTSPACVHCNHMKQDKFVEKLKKEYGSKIEIINIDTADAQGSIIFKESAEAYGKDFGVPAMAIGETYLQGYPAQIAFYAGPAVERALANNEATKITVKEVKTEDEFNKLTFSTIVLSGLADGINPCAFAVIIFFVSFLAVYGYNKKEVVYVGSAYCLAVFLAYFLIGLGLFEFLYAMSGFAYVIKIFYFLAAALCFVFFLLSLYDFVIYQKTKKSDGMLLQLPKNLKLKINKIIGFFMRGKEGKGRHPLRLIVAAFCVGILVSLVESVCTGQVYVPTIVLIMKDPHFRTRAVSYLILYNLLFILPLLIVFGFTLLGHKSEKVNSLFKKHLGITKLLLALVFLGLFIMLVIV